MSFFGEAVPAVSVIASSDMRVLKWSSADWRDVCEADPANGYWLAMSVGKIAVNRLRSWGTQVLSHVSWGWECNQPSNAASWNSVDAISEIQSVIDVISALQ